jgi:predicted CXXCH cytochrome family protein
MQAVSFDEHCRRCHHEGAAPGAVAPFDAMASTQGIRLFPGSRFSHADHAAADCERCHDARRSTDSSDVILPGIETCRGCHGDAAGAGGKVASPCLLCHVFHHDEHGPMRPELPRADRRDDRVLAGRVVAE